MLSDDVPTAVPIKFSSNCRVTWRHQEPDHHQSCYGHLARYAKWRVPHAPRMPGTFSPPPRISDPDMYRGTCVTHVPWYMPRSLTISFLWNRWRGKRSLLSRRMRNPQVYVFGKRTIALFLPEYSGFSTSSFNQLSAAYWTWSWWSLSTQIP